MGLTLGTNAGFVTVAPSADPEGEETSVTADNYARMTKDTLPATAVLITEVGFWCDNATEEANFEVGLYDDGDPAGGSRLFVDTTNAKGTTAGWKTASVNWDVSGYQDDILWIAYQLDDTATRSKIDVGAFLSGDNSYDYGETSLASEWAGGSPLGTNIAIYAVWDTVSGTAHEQDLTESLTFGESKALQPTKALSDSLSVGDSIIKQTGKNVSEALSIGESIEKAVAISKSESISLADSIVKDVVVNKVESLSFGEDIAKGVSISKTESLTVADSVDSVAIFLQELTEALSITDSVMKSTTKAITESLSVSDSVAKGASRSLSESLTIGDSVAKGLLVTKLLTESLSLVDSIIKLPQIQKTESLTFAEGLQKNMVKQLNESLTLAETLVKDMGIGLTEDLTVGESIAKLTNIYMTEGITITESLETALIKMIGLTETLTLLDKLTNSLTYNIYLTESLTVDVTFQRIVTLANRLAKTFINLMTDDLTDTFDPMGKNDVV